MKFILKNYKLFFSLFVLLYTYVAAAQKITLDNAIKNGLANNGMVKVATLETMRQSQLHSTAYDIAKTEVSGTFGQINTKAQDKHFSVSQTFSPFLYGPKSRLLNENIKSSEIRLGNARLEITYSIRIAWNALLYYAEMNKVLGRQDKLMQQFVKAAGLKLKTGETAALEPITATTKQQELQQQIRQNLAMIKSERAKLTMLLGGDDNFIVADTSFTALAALEIIDSTRINQNATIQLANQEARVADAAQKAEAAVLWPDITAGYFIQSLTGFQDVDGVNTYYNSALRFQGVSVGISIPVFAGAASGRIKAAKTNAEVQKVSAEYVTAQIKSSYTQEMEQFMALQPILQYYTNTALPNADIISGNATKAYMNGDIGYVEYVQGLETALGIRMNYINTVNRYNQSVINLQYLLNQ